MIIGIDFSINSTAITIYDGKEFSYYSFVPNYRPTLKGFLIHTKIDNIVEIHSYLKNGNTKDPIVDQSIKLMNADRLSNTIMEVLSNKIKKDPKFFIEGFSFASKGNSFIDLITFNTFMKAKIIQKWGDCITVISPKSLKKYYTGNGNSGKFEMLKSYFLKVNDKLSIRLNELGLNQDEEFNIPKPIDDLIDSISLCEWGQSQKNENKQD
jgi:hypothetical protein